MTVFASGLADPETPVFLPDGSFLVAETGAPGGAVTHVSADGRALRRLWRGGRPNGVASCEQSIWVALTEPPSLAELDRTGALRTMISDALGVPFLFPNDLCFGPDGLLYLTDSGITRADLDACAAGAPVPTTPIRGRVLRFDPRSGEFLLLGEHAGFVNGLAFAPSGTLAVCETTTGAIYVYDVASRRPRHRRLLGIADHGRAGAFTGPDGMAFASDGRLFVALYGYGEIAVIDENGAVRDRVRTAGRLPTNLAFGPAGERAIYVTEEEHDDVERHAVAASGARVYGHS